MPGSRRTRPRVLALYGSPRKKGHSARIHDAFLAPLAAVASVKRVRVQGLNVSPCTACGHCRGGLSCVFDDDMSALYEEIERARLISISAPVYFSGLPGALKCVIDRFQVLWEARERGEKRPVPGEGFFISVSGAEYRNVFLPSVTTIRHFFNSLGIAYREKNFLLFPAVEEKWKGQLPGEWLTRASAAGERYARALLSDTPGSAPSS
ncbi:MAG: flavodoxin family protein [Spirochaetes bacterium]|nr:MAG: flavodoxin family protein [Spirochaetota bacterium]